ncbi:MAG: S9 family peptidase, partial [Sphingopyxis sp.]|nr:S9 family peptidase [Sphingopyxis sp.]
MIRRLLPVLLLAAAPATIAAQTAPAPAAVEVRQVGSARLENVPEIPADVSAAVQRYQNFRSAQFQDWLPDGSMLITTRFGSTAQVHRVAAPGAARQQLTFYGEPVANAEAIPGRNAYVVTRDTGGDEWFQLYVRGLDGSSTALTEAGTRNQSTSFSRDGSLMAWSRAVRGSADFAILVANPADPASARLLWQGTGAVAPASISADGRTILVSRGISNRENRLMLLDVASASVRPLDIPGGPARYESPRFIRNGAAILAISNNGSDVRRLVEIDVANGGLRAISPELPWDIEAYDLSDDGRVLAYVVNEDGFSRVVVQDFVTRRALPQPDLPRGVLTALDFSPDGSKLAVGLTTARSAGDVWTHDVAGGELTRWTTSELGDLHPARLAEPELVRFNSFDGLSVPA